MTTSEMATVLAWHDALAARDLTTLESLSSDGIEVAQPHAAGQGHRALREWAQTVTIITKLGRMYIHDGVVVVELIPEDPDAPVEAAAFQVVDDQVTSVFRHPDLDAALAATRLTEADRID
ncbi:nuclear transport factor 2 family protein [Mycolicibacillus parakoreensis]|uniref:Nuclear transport factor 2 family protein n=1 Tax=Mycolicibacillus parakoreensis TaxID=1069221 RepID=A0ABY3TXV9_9MYCO|nr:nuclear transport factor 2 family protein [Mycolicibacillus parakoreensis]MCV7316306.1 nuclear transport factor 2 family protein [Mycolicibacillus parakoreensis]ULN52552.1 nuclear transport factor 2 family protein [Mycolicibacillus parakoreensis]